MTQIENEQIKALREELKETNGHISELTTGFNALKSAIVGNDITKDGGIVKRLTEIEAAQLKSDEWQKKMKWMGALGIGFFALIEVLYQSTSIIEFFIGHKK
jgi:hypothetical protein